MDNFTWSFCHSLSVVTLGLHNYFSIFITHCTVTVNDLHGTVSTGRSFIERHKKSKLHCYMNLYTYNLSDSVLPLVLSNLFISIISVSSLTPGIP
jgi:hypothetical protein